MSECRPIFDHQSGLWRCENCGFAHREHFRKNCLARRRPRTPEEIESALLICIACEHRTAEGLCGLLKREGCGSCRSIADFSAKLRRGMGCPDGRFPATELVEPTKTQSVEHPHLHESPYNPAKSDEPSPS